MKALFYPNWDTAHIPEMTKEIFTDDIYYWMLHDKQHLTAKTDMIVVDAGANLGLVAQRIIPFAKTIIALEPEEQNFEALQMNIAYNKWTNVVPVKKALWTYNGKVDLTVNKENGGNHSIVPSFTGEKNEVECITLEYLMQDQNIETIDLLKMDIQGAEKEVFASDQFRNCLPKVKELLIKIQGNDTSIIDYLKQQKFFPTKTAANGNCYWATNMRQI